MLDTKRYWFQSLETIIGRVFSLLPISPNGYTCLSGVFGLMGMYCLITQKLAWAIIFFFSGGFLDFIDGAVARNKNASTKVGAYLDTIFDRYVEGMIFFGLLFLPLPTIGLPAYAWIFLAMFGSIITTYAKAAAKEKELVNQELKGGLLSRGERLILIFIALILGLIYPDFKLTVYLLIIIAVLSNFTALQRIYSAISLNKHGR
jgi:phosphatidylglycerophosphate synthase